MVLMSPLNWGWHKFKAWSNTMFWLCQIAIAAFQHSDGIGLLFPLDYSLLAVATLRFWKWSDLFLSIPEMDSSVWFSMISLISELIVETLCNEKIFFFTMKLNLIMYDN